MIVLVNTSIYGEAESAPVTNLLLPPPLPRPSKPTAATSLPVSRITWSNVKIKYPIDALSFELPDLVEACLALIGYTS
jgi:hypothetical protein